MKKLRNLKLDIQKIVAMDKRLKELGFSSGRINRLSPKEKEQKLKDLGATI